MSPYADSKKSGGGGGGGSTLLPIMALTAAQLFNSSWHVLGKHVMHQVPFLAPISYVLARTLASCSILLVAGTLLEGHIPFPPLFLYNSTTAKELGFDVGLLKPSGVICPLASTESGNSIGLSLSQNSSTHSLNNKKIEQISSPLSQNRRHHHHHRPRRKKQRSPSIKNSVITKFYSMIPSIEMAFRNINYTSKYCQQLLNNLNPDAVQIICAGLSGMLILPSCYITGLILTSPTVASVWDGPMIPLGCFCSAVVLGVEKRSKLHPIGQVGSLLLTVGGSIVVLLVDFLGGGHGIPESSGGSKESNDHVQFIQGNMVLVGVVVAYSATALLQKRLNNYPPIHLTGWMFGIGFLGCLTLLLVDTILLGSRITGVTLSQSLVQIHLAFSTSPTFRYGFLYSALFVGCLCFSISSYASAHLESSVITLFAAMQPPMTAVLELIWEGKGLGWKKLVGMICVGLGMQCFTYIKRVEKETMDTNHKKKMQILQKHGHAKKSQSYESKGNVQVGYGNGNGRDSPNSSVGSSSNLTNRKAHADV